MTPQNSIPLAEIKALASLLEKLDGNPTTRDLLKAPYLRRAAHRLARIAQERAEQ